MHFYTFHAPISKNLNARSLLTLNSVLNDNLTNIGHIFPVLIPLSSLNF